MSRAQLTIELVNSGVDFFHSENAIVGKKKRTRYNNESPFKNFLDDLSLHASAKVAIDSLEEPLGC